MAGKGFKDKVCVYCRRDDVPTIGEHVFGRKLFAVRHRMSLPKVPGCEACNTTKSQLENYVMAAVPLGANHASAREYAEANVERRLAANLPLRRSIVASMKRSENGILAYSVDSAKVLELMLMAAMGLFAYHFGRPLHPDWEVRVRHVSSTQEAEGIATLASMVGPNPESVHWNLGEGTIEYWGQRSHRLPYCSGWRFVPFGGLVWTGNPEAPGETYSTILCATMRRKDCNGRWARRSGQTGKELEVLKGCCGVLTEERELRRRAIKSRRHRRAAARAENRTRWVASRRAPVRARARLAPPSWCASGTPRRSRPAAASRFGRPP